MTSKLYREEVALAMELRTEGCLWKVIAEGLGVSESTLIGAVKRAKDYGRDPRPPVYRPWLGRVDMGAEKRPGGARKAAGGDAGQLEADHVDAAADTARAGEAEWIGDSCRAIDRRVYGS